MHRQWTKSHNSIILGIALLYGHIPVVIIDWGIYGDVIFKICKIMVYCYDVTIDTNEYICMCQCHASTDAI